jgi:hypothetical protein
VTAPPAVARSLDRSTRPDDTCIVGALRAVRYGSSELSAYEYRLESVSTDGKALEFVTVRIENFAPGWQAKKSYRVLSSDEIEETFSLAPPGKDFDVYTLARLRRVK